MFPFGSAAPDLPWQLRLGHSVASTHSIPHAFGSEAFAASGMPWYPDQWLSSALAWWAFQSHGLIAVGIADGILALAALVLVALRTIRRGARPGTAIGASLLAALCMLGSLYAGLDPLSWFFFALVLFLLDADSRRFAFAVPVLTFVWAIFDGRALLAVLAALSSNLRLRDRAVVVAACLLAVTLTPLGVHLPLQTLGLVHVDSFLPWANRIEPWTLENQAFIIGMLGITLLAGWFGMSAERRAQDGFQFAIFLILALLDGRNAPFFGICAAPLVAGPIEHFYLRLQFSDAPRSSVAPLLVAIGVMLVCILAVAKPFHAAGDSTVRRALADHRRHNVYCENLRWCTSLAASQAANLAIFMDGRDAAFPQRIRENQHTIASVSKGWQAVLRDNHVDTVVAKTGMPLATILSLNGRWRVAGADGMVTVLERANVEARK